MTLGVSSSLPSLALSLSSLGGWNTQLAVLWWLRMQIGGLSTWVFRIHFRTKWSYQLYGLNTIKHTQFLLWNSEFKITAVTATWVKLQRSSLLIWSWLSHLTFEESGQGCHLYFGSDWSILKVNGFSFWNSSHIKDRKKKGLSTFPAVGKQLPTGKIKTFFVVSEFMLFRFRTVIAKERKSSLQYRASESQLGSEKLPVVCLRIWSLDFQTVRSLSQFPFNWYKQHYSNTEGQHSGRANTDHRYSSQKTRP